jgi:hypothetical protein
MTAKSVRPEFAVANRFHCGAQASQAIAMFPALDPR